MPMVIPERTIDAWTSSEATAFDAFARVWAPDQATQGRSEPWDFAIAPTRSSEKIFMLENKGLYSRSGYTFVRIDVRQLLILIWLHQAFGLPTFVGLPHLSASEALALADSPPLHRAMLRLFPRPFGDWHEVFSPIRLARIPRVEMAIRESRRSVAVSVDLLPRGRPLRQFLRDVANCREGWLMGEEGFNVRGAPPSWTTSATFGLQLQQIASRGRWQDIEAHFAEHQRELTEPLDARDRTSILGEVWVVVA